MTDQPLHDHWNDLYLRRWWVILTMVVACFVAYFFSTMVTPVYQAKTTFFLAANQLPPQFVADAPDAAPQPLLPVADEKAAGAHVGILRGRELRERLGEQVGMSSSALAKAMIVTVSGEFMIDIFVRDEDPDRAAQIANAVPAAYAAFHETSMRNRSVVVVDALRQELALLDAEREALVTKLQEARRKSLSTADLSAIAILQSQREAALADRDALDARIIEETARSASFVNTLENEAGLYRSGKTMDTTRTADELLTTLLELRVQIASAGSASNSPRVRNIHEQLVEIEQQMAIEQAKISNATAKSFGSLHEEVRLQNALTDASLAGLRAAQIAADSRLNEATKRFSQALITVTESDQISTRLIVLNNQIDTARTNLDAAHIQSANAKAPLVVVETAAVPTKPAFPLPILNAIVAALTAMMLGSYFALLLAHNDRVSELRRRLATPMPLFDDDDLRALDPASIEVSIRSRLAGGDIG